MHTRDGDYAAACSMDFATSSRYHDSLALRDSQGQRTASSYFPWFHSPASLVAVRRGDPVPVASCWNGLVVFDAAPFYPDFSLHDGKTHVDGRRDGAGGDGAAAMMLTDEHERHAALAKRDDKLDRFDRDHDSIELPEQQASSRQKEQQQHRHRALRFRAIPDSLAEHRLEGSERCLIHFDNPLSASRGVWLNPSVRVAYSVSTYISVRRLLGAPDARDFPGAIATIVGAWVNRWQRWHGGVALALDRWTVRRRVARWMADGDRLGGEESARREIGEVCLVADMLALRKRPPALEP